MRLRQRLLLECSEPGVRLSLVVRGVGRRSSERHRRAADKRLLLPVIWLVAERNQARTADSEREWHTQLVSAFRRGAAGAGAPDAHEKGRARRSTPRCHSASCRTLQLHAFAEHVRAVPLELLLFLLDDVKMSRTAKFDTFCDHAANGRLADVQRMLESGELPVNENLNEALWRAAENGHVDVVDCLLRHAMFDPSANNNEAVRRAAENGHLAVVERLLEDKRVDPSADDNQAVRWAARRGHLAVVDRLIEDDRVDVAVAIQSSRPEDRKRFECRERLTEICIGLQDLALPAWVTVQILDAARPWSTLPLHSKWNLVCAVKHYHDKKQ